MRHTKRLALLAFLALAASARADGMASYKIVQVTYTGSSPLFDSSSPNIDDSGNLVSIPGRVRDTGIYQLGSVQDSAPGMQNITLSWYLHANGSNTNLLPTSLQDASKSTPLDYNSSGIVIGNSAGQPYIYSAATGQFLNVQSLPGQTGPPYLSAINNAGQIVGYNNVPLFYSSPTAVPVPLVDMLPANSGWLLLSASDINNLGEIVGTGVNPSGKLVDFEMIPTATPEPTSLAILGFGVFFYAGRQLRSRFSNSIVK